MQHSQCISYAKRYAAPDRQMISMALQGPMPRLQTRITRRGREQQEQAKMNIAHVTVFVYRRQKIAEIRVFSNARLSTSIKHAEAFIRKMNRRVGHDAFIDKIKQEQI